ncbi:hypothetical protein Mhun_1921 [Methanospirillum hungatei JF-1]|uniref:Uncharacterized protein n=1 Tax=Methanospirillum hungatei JF-1 (strain ATCC 27890 / DSM 864 / NBRC 100397 / JF-1) TaxID=323259 RepID=Q2FLT4_METHJ|nr:hypothetical protein [Methanospirillum hungatei]ABD41632.1 hypothetical protein Mhun_1921 [Methanospirillum hungatei JF-1]
MISLPSYLTTLAPWEFSVYIAPRDVIQAALPDAAGAFRSVVYLHGNSGTRLLKEHPDRHISYVLVLGFDDLMAYISGAKGSLLLIEYCDEWFMDDPDRIRAFGEVCKNYSRKRGAAVLLSVRVNYVIRTLQPFIGPVQWVQTSPRYALSQTPLFICEEQQVFRYGQQTLGV